MIPGMLRGGIWFGCLSSSLVPAQEVQDETPVQFVHFNTDQDEADPDITELFFRGGVRFASDVIEMRADAAVIRVDRDAYYQLTGLEESSGLPRRGTTPPDPRRTLSPDLMVRRFESFLGSLGNTKTLGAENYRDWFALLRSVYLEGNIVMMNAGVEVLTADSLMFSLPDNRAVFEGVELRLVSQSSAGVERMLVVRAPRLVKQGVRITGRDVSITTCTAGEAHFEVLSAQVEIIERSDEFEVFSRGNTLAFSGRPTVPLPDAHFFTGEQSEIPIKGLRARYSEREGFETGIDIGGSANDVGGALHEFITGRPAHEFRSDWRLGATYNEVRGAPLDGDLTWSAGSLYEGRVRGFYLEEDHGPNLGFIRTYLDGTLITETERSMIDAQNRIRFSDTWTADLTVFAASDPAVYPEFSGAEHLDAEIPETSAVIRHADENRLFTLTGRTNLTSFTYGDDRSLAPSFTEEAPLATYDLFSHPVGSFGNTDVLLSSSTEAGWWRHEFDPRFAAPVMDRTFRFDQKLELATPSSVGPFAIRPYGSARFTYYDNSVTADELERWALDAGVSITTRLARTFTSTTPDGGTASFRHRMYPSVAFGHQFQVDGTPSDYFQFDGIDRLDENALIRLGVLNLFDRSETGPKANDPNGLRRDAWNLTRNPGEFFHLDLAQNLLPISDRDNNGELLGLFEYEMIWRPKEVWVPVPNLRVLLEGEHDWNNHRARTMNVAARFGKVLGVNWSAGYRTDEMVRGTVQYGASADMLGRWRMDGWSAYDLETEQQLDYNAMLTRQDHDWVIRVGIGYSQIRDEVSFNINFQPLFGGLFRERPRDFAGTYGRGPDALLNN